MDQVCLCHYTRISMRVSTPKGRLWNACSQLQSWPSSVGDQPQFCRSELSQVGLQLTWGQYG